MPMMIARLFVLLLFFAGAAQAWPGSELSTIAAARLPPEARETLARIHAGGPFPFHRDGARFQNREGRLPAAAAEGFREYTVITPGAADRGARRIISAGHPPDSFYYTDDHYRSFRRIEE